MEMGACILLIRKPIPHLLLLKLGRGRERVAGQQQSAGRGQEDLDRPGRELGEDEAGVGRRRERVGRWFGDGWGSVGTGLGEGWEPVLIFGGPPSMIVLNSWGGVYFHFVAYSYSCLNQACIRCCRSRHWG